MKIDAGTVWCFAALSLLTGAKACTAPTEELEITKRAKDMLKFLEAQGHEPVYSATSYVPYFPGKKWPFATSEEDIEPMELQFAADYSHADGDVDVDTLIELLKAPELEEKYRLSRVKQDCTRQVLLPF